MIHIPSELARIYLDKMDHHKKKLPFHEALKYYEFLCELGLLSVVLDGEEIVAVVEWYRINFEQTGKLICFAPFNIYDEDILNGKIAYLSDIWIKHTHRHTSVIKRLRHDFFLANADCDYFWGEAERKKAGYVKVFKRQEVFNKWAIDQYQNEFVEKEN